MDILRDKAAIAGIGVHKFSKNSGITEMEMACLAIRSALDDAGLTPDSIDGFVEYAAMRLKFTVGWQNTHGERSVPETAAATWPDP